MHSGKVICSSWSIPEKQASRRDPSRNKETGRRHFPPLPLSISRATCQNQCKANIHYLTCLHQASPPHALVDLPFPVLLALGSAKQAPSPRTLPQTPSSITSPHPGVIQGTGSRALVKITFRPGTKQCPQEAKKAFADDKRARTQQQSTYSTHWKHSWKCQALQNRRHYTAGHHRTSSFFFFF